MPFPIINEFIKRTESILGFEFPIIYRSGMMKCNGGTIETEDDAYEIVPIYNEENIKTLKRTFPGVARMTLDHRQMECFPLDGVVVAQNGTGDCLILMVNGNGILGDEIWHWEFHGGTLTKIADNLDEIRIECK